MQKETRDILDTLPYGSLIIDQDNRILFANRWIQRHLSDPNDKIVGKPLHTITVDNQWTITQIEMARFENRPVVLSQLLHSYFIPIPLPKNHLSGYEFMQQEVIIAPVQDHRNWLHITLRDVTSGVVGHEKNANLRRELEAERNKAQQENSRKERFLALMSHDIRTPMNGVLGYAEMLSVTELDETQEMYVDVIKSSGDMLLQLVNEILDFSKIKAGKLKIEPALFSIRDCTREVLDIFKPEAAFKSIELKLNYSKRVPVKFYQDGMRYKQVLTNLVSNAVKFTREGKIEINVDCVHEVKTDELCLQVEVRDTGVGISAEHLPNLFQEYVQVDGDRPFKATGSGLGLAICKELCSLMGGDTSAESEPGEGSIFRFSIRCDPSKVNTILQNRLPQTASR